MHEGRSTNRLIHEKSPYLLQHAHNPVDWYPWGDEAFDRARRENKPIFLSIGYSTCHWCHVMERESFESERVAAAMNRWFVSIKVDREERPDVDRLYMNAAFAVTGGGGWPLSVFLTPEGKPFFAGTYFPPESRGGHPGFLDVLQGIHEAWEQRRPQVDSSATQLSEAVARAMSVAPSEESAGVEDARRLAYEHLIRMFDGRRGGFGHAPKFPQPSYLSFLFREWAATGETRARDMALLTLRRMAQGGIHDHLAGGFHRYSTDGEWRVPHFEKMLYDQAQLAMVYVEAWQITRERFFADVARDVLDYVSRDLSTPEGGFASAEDADSRDASGAMEEGAYYVWTAAEVESILGPERAAPFARHYDLTPAGNFEHGKNVLFATGTGEEGGFDQDRARLLAERSKRARPHLDDKVITAWNGLAISAYARAAQALGEPRYEKRARAAADFLWSRLRDERTGALWRRYRDGEAAVPGELSDYAFTIQGFLDLYETSFEPRDLERALALARKQDELFWDGKDGGFFDTANDAETRLFVRGKEAHDGAEPSGNSVAVLDLARLARMTGEEEWEQKARRTLDLFTRHVARSPLALTQMWASAYFLQGKPAQVVIAGTRDATDTRRLLEVAREGFRPGQVVLLADGGEGQEWLSRRLEFLRTVRPVGGRATAYVCENFTCKLPVTTPAELGRQLALSQPASVH